MNRRKFLNSSAGVAAGLAFYGAVRTVRGADSPNNTMRVAVMGLSRGLAHVGSAGSMANVEVAWLCDIDEKKLAGGVKALEGKQQRAPQTSNDIRRVLDLKDLDEV